MTAFRVDAPLRVGYVLKKYPRLSETFILQEILGLEDAGAEVTVISLRLPDDGRFHAELARVRASVHYLPETGSAAFLEALRLAADPDTRRDAGLAAAVGFVDLLPAERRAGVLLQGIHLAGRIRALGLDHVHAHFATIAAHVAHVAHLLTGIPYSVTAHAKDVYRDAVDPVVFAAIAATATAVVTVCEANRRHILKHLAPAGSRVKRIYNGISLQEFGNATASPRDPTLIVAAGRLVEKKGFDVLLEACAILRDRGIAFRCEILGDGEERGRLEELRDSLSLGDRVRLAGAVPRDAILDAMRRARVLAAPCVAGADGNRDALPTVLLEALAAGLPSVATGIGGIPEILDHGVQGLLVPEREPVALADAIHHVLQDEATWRDMSAAARRRAEERFDRDATLPALIHLFEESRSRHWLGERARPVAVGA